MLSASILKLSVGHLGVVSLLSVLHMTIVSGEWHKVSVNKISHNLI